MKIQAMSFEADNFNIQKKRNDEYLKQVQITFYVSIILLIIGVLIIFAGLILFFTQNSLGGITTVFGAISGIIGSIIFGFYSVVNKKLEESAQDLDALARHLDGTHVMEELIDRIRNPDKKDGAIINLIRFHQTGPQRINRNLQATPQHQGGLGIIRRIFHNLF